MTAFASFKGNFATTEWTWEMRSVNARGLDLRLRIPDWLEGLEGHARTKLSEGLTRGNVTVSLRVSQSEEATTLKLNETVLDGVLSALQSLEDRAQSIGVDLAPARSSDLLAVRGVLETAGTDADDTSSLEAMKATFAELLAQFVAMRESEGKALEAVLSAQLAEIDRLARDAAAAAERRRPAMLETLTDQVARVADAAPVEPERIAQEVALLTVKADVTEELDRLRTHVVAARDLIEKGGPVGRRLDFLCQEFNREANTLCSKSQFAELTTLGLDLKATIDQMREQVQNIE
jgi:uncharacterized protein (TIGR00255 family)